MTELDPLRYPIGKFTAPAEVSFEQVQAWIGEIEQLPSRLRDAVAGLSDEQLDTPYRPGGWTLRQVVHHIPDSHANAYVRFKWAYTEENPIIKPYFEDRWAECEEAKHAPVDVSLAMLEQLHKRWVLFMRSLEKEDFERTYVHPEHGRQFILKNIAGMYAWHGEHHLQHILMTRKSKGWD
jgi:hypothetical protein